MKAFSRYLLLVCVVVSCTMEVPEDIVVSFSETKNRGNVTFINNSEGATSYMWDFGDGQTSSETAPTHNYSRTATYQVKLIAMGEGGSKAFSRAVTVDLESTPVAQTFEKLGDYTFGGGDYDQFRAGIATVDGGAILVGSSKSQPNNGDNDFFIVKVNSNGSAVWQKKYGGSQNDGATCIVQVDGGYLVGGYSNSDAGGNKSADKKGAFDFWVVKINDSGDKLGDYSFGGAADDLMNAIVKTSDNGILLGGFSRSGSNGNKTTSSLGDADFWLVKINSNGVKQWDRTYGGKGDDRINSMAIGKDNVVMLAGYSDSPTAGDRTSTKYNHYDYWVLKVKENGDRVSDYSFGGNGEDQIYSIINEARYLAGGESKSNGGEGTKSAKDSPKRGESDYYVYRFDDAGATTWEFTYGGDGKDRLTGLHALSGGNLLLVGESNSPASGNKTAPGYGQLDGWVVKVNADGKIVDDVSYGGSGNDVINCVIKLTDGTYLFAGESNSPVSANKSGINIGGGDGWVVKVKVN